MRRPDFVIVCRPGMAVIVLLAAYPVFVETCPACTVGVAHGSATTDGRPLLWKMRDADDYPQQLVRIKGPAYYYLASRDINGSVFQGLNSAGLACGNSAVGSGSNSAPQVYALGRFSEVSEVKNYFAQQINSGSCSASGCFPFIDASGNAAVLEINNSQWMYEYDATNPNRGAQGLSGIVVRANEFHQRSDGTDNTAITGGRYESGTYNINGLKNVGLLSAKTVLNGNAGTSGYEFARYGPGCSLATIARSYSRSAMVVHGVTSYESPALTTMWTILGQPNYGIAVPAWVSVANIPSYLADGSMYNRTQSLYSKGNESLTQASTLPFEIHIYDQVEKLLGHWRQLYSTPVSDMSRVENRIAEDAYSLLSCLDLTMNNNKTPYFDDDLAISGIRLTKKFNASAYDSDGTISSYCWNFGDGYTSTEVSPSHTFVDIGTYLISCTVTDDWDVSNTAWMYCTVDDTLPIIGDTNGDGRVDEEDAAALAANWLRNGDATWEQGDFNGDLKVDDRDAALLAINWQRGIASAATPEPSMLVLLIGATACIFISQMASYTNNLKHR